MSLKFTPRYVSEAQRAAALAELDIISASQEANEIYTEMVKMGCECKEIETVLHDVQFVKETIQKNGIRSYIYQFDKDNQFAAHFDVPAYQPGMGLKYAKELEAKYISAAEEGLKEYWHRFIEAIKTIFTKFVAWIQTTLTLRNWYIDRLKKHLEDFDKLDPEATIKGMTKSSCDKVLVAVKTIHDAFASTLSANTAFGIGGNAINNPAGNLVEALKHLGYELKFNKNEGEISLESENDLDELYPMEEKKTFELGFTASNAKMFAEELTKVESKSDFKKNANNAADACKKAIDDSIKLIKELSSGTNLNSGSKAAADAIEQEGKDIAVGMIKFRGQAVRVIARTTVLENKAMVRLCKTAIALMKATKKADK